MSRRTSSAAAGDLRQSELAKIHIAKKDLGLDDETYRAMLWTVGRVRSAKDLDAFGRRRVLDHLRARGFAGKRAPTRPQGRSFPGRPHNTDSNAQVRKVEALLADAGRPWAYADSMCQRMFGVDRVAFCGPQQLQKLIAALSYDQKRRAGNRARHSDRDAPA